MLEERPQINVLTTERSRHGQAGMCQCIWKRSEQQYCTVCECAYILWSVFPHSNHLHAINCNTAYCFACQPRWAAVVVQPQTPVGSCANCKMLLLCFPQVQVSTAGCAGYIRTTCRDICCSKAHATTVNFTGAGRRTVGKFTRRHTFRGRPSITHVCKCHEAIQLFQSLR
jgi:hypothetical protein